MGPHPQKRPWNGHPGHPRIFRTGRPKLRVVKKTIEEKDGFLTGKDHFLRDVRKDHEADATE
jgi:hypothetical protein